jgi:hypothetical protein
MEEWFLDWTVVAIILNKQSQATDKVWPSILITGRGQQFFTITIFYSFDISHKHSNLNWIYLALNKNQGLAPANMVNNLRVNKWREIS